MPFGTVKSVGVVQHEDERELRNRLSALSESISIAESRQQEFTVTQDELDEKKRELDEFQRVFSTDMKKLSSDRERLIEENSRLELKNASYRDDAASLKEAIKGLKAERAKEKRSITDLDDKKSELAVVENMLNAKLLTLDDISSDIETKIKKRDELNAVLSGLYEKIKEVTDELEVKTSKVLLLGERKNELEAGITNLESQYLEEETKMKSRLSKIESGLREDWNKREGDISKEREWINEKRESLRNTKVELEKYYNRKIDLVI